MLRKANPDDLDSIEWILPAGAAVPQSCQAKYKEKMRNLKVDDERRLTFLLKNKS